MKGAGVAGHHSIPTILVVDDEPMIRMAVTDHLKDCGFLVIEACDAEEAIEVLQAVPAIALVFSDVRMPGSLDGVGLARWLAQWRPRVPVILATGDMGKTYAAEELCVAHFFLKPYALDDVSRKVHDLLRV
jgi:CheY-like chemotaxis protein